MKMNVYMKGRDNQFDAFGIYEGKVLTVKKGSRITENVSKKIQPIVLRLREDSETVSNNILLKDVTFRSPSTAASFVSGTISNGMVKWKDKNGTPLRRITLSE